MAFKMTFNQSQLAGLEPVPAGLYRVRFVDFKPAKPKKEGATSVNLNADVVILDHPEWEKERTIRANLNTSIATFIQDFVHSFGLEMVDQLGEDPGIPGVFDASGSTFKADDPSTWKYVGPLTNKTAEWELGPPSAQAPRYNTIRKFICAVPQCATKFPKVQHSTDMSKKS